MEGNPLSRRPARRRALLAICAPLALLGASLPLHTATPAAAAPVAAGFTPGVRADTGDGSKAGQNEPQVTVDRTGLAYVTWQYALASDSPLTTTRDGVHFSAFAYPDKGNNDDGDVTLAHVSYPSTGHVLGAGPSGANGVFYAQLGPGMCGAIEIRAATTTDGGATWQNPGDASCQPCQVDRPWVAAYTPAADRDTADATKHTMLYMEHHDFCASNVWMNSSSDGGATWNTVPVNAEQIGSAGQLTSLCNSIPGGVAVAQGGAHAGRVFAVWSTSDPAINATTGCNYSQFQPFDHIFVSYSDDNGSTWTSRDVYDDPCDPNPPAPPASLGPTSPVGTCQDVSELFDAVASDDAGNVYISYTARNVNDANPEYDTYVASSSDGGDTWTSHNASSGVGTHYAPWIAAGGSGGIDVVYYSTPYVEGVGNFNKPATAPSSAVWDVYMAQSLDGGRTWTNSRVSNHSVYFGDFCTTGISCGTALSGANNWGADRILCDDFGVAIGPDGGARIAWTDAHDSWTSDCAPGGTTSCQKSHIYFACQNSGVGLHGESITGCGSVAAAAPAPVSTATPAPAAGAVQGANSLPNTGAAPDGDRVALLLLLAAGACGAGAAARRRSRRA